MAKLTHMALAIGLGLALAAPAMAQDEMNAKDLPRCSATVKDHCMSDGSGGGHRMGMKHHGKHHGRHHGKHHGKHHRKHHGGHHKGHGAMKAKDAKADGAKPM